MKADIPTYCAFATDTHLFILRLLASAVGYNNNNLYFPGFSLYKRKIIEGNILWVANVRIVAKIRWWKYLQTDPTETTHFFNTGDVNRSLVASCPHVPVVNQTNL